MIQPKNRTTERTVEVGVGGDREVGGGGWVTPITAIFEKGVGDGVGRSKCVIFSKCVI